MPMFFRLRFGPYVGYQRLGRTQAQKRARAKARMKARIQREMENSTFPVTYTLRAVEPDGVTLVLCRDSAFGELTERIPAPPDTPALMIGQAVEVRKRMHSVLAPSEIVSIRPLAASPAHR